MFKLHRHRADRFGERFEFKFFNFRLLQVPKGWDKLFLSIVSVETAKTVAKSSKATVRSGICQWPDSVSEMIWFSQDDVSKEFEECQYKIVVSMGSTKTGTLGEIALNLTGYLSTTEPNAISSPLKKCNSGTVLQLKVQCLSTKCKLRDSKSWNETSSRRDELSPTNDDMDSRSDGSDSVFNRSIGSSSGNNLGGTYQDEPGNRDTSFSASGSHRSSNSGDSTVDRTGFSPKNNLNGGLYVGRQDSTGSYVSNASAGRGDDICRSNNSSFNLRNNAQALENGLSQSSIVNSDSSKDLLDVTEETIDELRDAAKMWERHSRKLKIDLETLKKECSDKSKKQAELEAGLSAAHAERDSLKQEINDLKSPLEDMNRGQAHAGTPKHQNMIDLHKELEDEVKFQKETNANLTLQLRKTQDANIELISILQELEETIEAQRLEISKLSEVTDVTEYEDSKNELAGEAEAEWARKLSLKEEEITMLKKKLSSVLDSDNANCAVSDIIRLDLEKENAVLKAQIIELEKDCAELTDENLELIYKMKQGNDLAEDNEGPSTSKSYESEIVMLTSQIHELEEVRSLETKCADLELKLLSFKSEVCDLQEKLQKSQEELLERNLELSELKHKLESLHIVDSDSVEADGTGRFRNVEQFKVEDMEETESEVDVLKADVLLKQQEVYSLQHSKEELEKVISYLQKEKSRLEKSLAVSLEESSITSKCLDDLQHDLVVLTSSIDSHVSCNETLEKKTKELESCKVELELHMLELEQENIQLSEQISAQEAQLRYMTNDKESSKLKLDDSRSLILNLKDKVERQQAEMETLKLELKQKQQEAQKRLLEAQEDSEVLRRSNSKLQATAESLIEECSSLRNLNAELKKQKLELHERTTQLEFDLKESQKRSLDFSNRVEHLEAKLSLLQKDISSKEQSLLSELENIFQEHQDHEQRITRVHVMLNKIETEKTIEAENHAKEITSLTAQVSSTHDEREKGMLDAIREVSSLRTQKAKLESSLRDVSSQMKLYETQLEALRQESKSKIQGLVDSLNASKQSEEVLMSDVQHMQRLMEAAKSNEDKFRKTSCELEMKLKSTDYEKQEKMEEISELKFQVQKIASLQDEVFKLKSSLDEFKFGKGKLEEQLQSVSEECEELKTEKLILTDKISYMQEALNNGEDERCSKVASEVQLESDLSAKDASYAHETELKNELRRFKRANSEFQRKIQCLEQEKVELTRRIQLLEEGLKMPQIKGTIEGNNDLGNGHEGILADVEADLQSRVKLLERQLAEALEENGTYKEQVKRSLSEKQLSNENDTEFGNNDKIASLEAELKDVKERLSTMSLQYAEVEAQREQLVMQLKSMKNNKRWF